MASLRVSSSPVAILITVVDIEGGALTTLVEDDVLDVKNGFYSVETIESSVGIITSLLGD